MLNKSIPKFKNQQERIEYWRTICKARLTSNLTNVKFCAQHNISEATLYRWSKYFEKQQANTTQSSKSNSIATTTKKSEQKTQYKRNPTFMPVIVTEPNINSAVQHTINHSNISAEEPSFMELLMPNGIKLIFNQAIGVDLLMQLITARC